jgi:hypothetical protein
MATPLQVIIYHKLPYTHAHDNILTAFSAHLHPAHVVRENIKVSNVVSAVN